MKIFPSVNGSAVCDRLRASISFHHGAESTTLVLLFPKEIAILHRITESTHQKLMSSFRGQVQLSKYPIYVRGKSERAVFWPNLLDEKCYDFFLSKTIFPQYFRLFKNCQSYLQTTTDYQSTQVPGRKCSIYVDHSAKITTFVVE